MGVVFDIPTTPYCRNVAVTTVRPYIYLYFEYYWIFPVSLYC